MSLTHHSRRGSCTRLLAVVIIFSLLAATLWWARWYDNYHVVIPGKLYRSAQMLAPRLQQHITADGIRTVVNLRPETNALWHAQEQQACEAAAVAFVDVPLAGDRPPSSQQTSNLVTILWQARPPILIHCERGADRTSFAVALYLTEVSGESEQQARAAFSIRYGHMAFTRVGCFDDAFARFCQHRHSPALP